MELQDIYYNKAEYVETVSHYYLIRIAINIILRIINKA